MTTSKPSLCSASTLCVALFLLFAASRSSAGLCDVVQQHPGFLHSVHNARIIVDATARDSTAVRLSNIVHTVYTLDVSETLKGPHTDTLVIAELGGRIGSFGTRGHGFIAMKPGQRYILLLQYVPTIPYPRVFSAEFAAVVKDDTATLATEGSAWSPANEYLALLRETLAECSPERLARRTDAILLGSVVSVVSSQRAPRTGLERDDRAILQVSKVLKAPIGSGRRALAAGQLTIQGAKRADPGIASYATSARVQEGASGYWFLRFEEGEWRLLPTLYACWSIVGDSCVVRTHGYGYGVMSASAMKEEEFLSAIASHGDR